MSSVEQLPKNGQVIEYEAYIDQQIQKTRFFVKLVDMAGAGLMLAVFWLAGLMLLVIVDHWIVGLNSWARAISLLVLSGVSLWLIITRLLPLAFRGINPIYAAHTVEKSHPSLKNGLINFLLFRSQRHQLREVVYRAIEQRAATDLSRIEVDASVDRGPVIRLGYGLAGLLALWCGYLLLSPKNPLQTVARVAAPWREIARPSKVRISDVVPGDTSVYRGQGVKVRAVVRGLASGQPVSILFSTVDGQLIDREIPMRRSESGLRHVGQLTTGRRGIQQDLTYQVVAGDAISPHYHVTAVEAPNIVVEQVEYDFPTYTQLPDELIRGKGDIRALEGTRVTIHGLANQDVRAGHIELDTTSEAAVDPTATAADPSARTVPMKTDGRRTVFRFRLALRDVDQSPLYSSYRLYFVNHQGVANGHPVQHTIEVIPDLKPLVEILTPGGREIELPENAVQPIEIRALDPDFALRSIQLRARSKGQDLMAVQLLDDEHVGQAVVNHRFSARAHQLRAGDVVEYWAEAEDNRTDTAAVPNPNRAQTEVYLLRIVTADPTLEPRGESSSSEPGATDAGSQGQEAGDAAGQTNSDGPPNETESGEHAPESANAQQGPHAGQDDGPTEQAGGEASEAGNGSARTQSSPTSGGTDDENSRDSSPADQNPQGDGAGESSRRQDDDNPDTGGSSRSDGHKSQEPLPSDGSRDGDVVERIQEHLRQMQAEGGNDPSQGDAAGRDGQGDRFVDAPPTPGAPPEPTTTIDDSAGQQGKHSGEPSGAQPPGSSDGSGLSEQPQRTQRPNPAGNPTDESRDGSASDEDLTAKQGRGDRPAPADDNPAGPQETKSGDEEGKSGDAAQAESSPDSDASSRPAGDTRPNAGDTSSDPTDTTPEGGDRDADSRENSSAPPGSKGSGRDQPAVPADGEASGAQGSPGADASSASDQVPKDKPEQPDQDAQRPSADGTATEGRSTRAARQTSANGGGAEGAADQAPTERNGERPGGEPGGDDANLQYARKATDLVLEYLRDQQQKPDQQLLDKLGWTPKDVRAFLDRWQRMKRQAAEPGPDAGQARRDLAEMLRSMGLRPSREQLRRDAGGTDEQRGLRDTGRRTIPPPAYRDQYDAYLKGTAISRDAP